MDLNSSWYLINIDQIQHFLYFCLKNSFESHSSSKFWNYEKNGENTPRNVRKCSNITIWLNCEKGKHKPFKQTPSCVSGQNQGCSKCRMYKGEKALEYSAKKMGLNVDFQKTFQTLVYKKPLRIDMYISKQENKYFEGILFPVCVEYDGNYYKGSHFPSENHNEEAKNNHLVTYKRDKAENEWAKNENRHILRIPYTSWEGSKNKNEEMLEILKKGLEYLKGKIQVQKSAVKDHNEASIASTQNIIFSIYKYLVCTMTPS